MGVRIAFCSSEWNFEVIKSVTNGIQRFLRRHPDAQVVTFREMSKYGTKDAGRGDHEIFSLPKPSCFDGFVIQGNQVWNQTARTEYVQQLRRHQIPVVSINYAIEGSTYIGTDNRGALREMTEGMIDRFRTESPDESFSIAFIRGLSRSLEAKHREQGFFDACENKQLREVDIRVFDGSWAAAEGAAAAKCMLQDREHLPRVIICANDDLAGGAAEVLLAAGVRVPEDVAIAGFDNLNVSQSFRPRLVSVDRDYTGTIETAIETLYQIIKTGEQPETVYSPYRILYQDQLLDGTNVADADMEHLRDEIWKLQQRNFAIRDQEKQRFLLQDQIEPALLSCRTMGEILDVFERFMGRYGNSRGYVVINTDYRYGNERAAEIKHFSEKMALAAIVGDEATQYVSNPITHCYEIFDRQEILPKPLAEQKALLDVFPLHYGETCIGYLVFENTDDVLDYACLESINTLMVNAIENARTRALLQKVNDRLDEMYLLDSLTGLYNRYGLDKRGRNYFEKLRSNRDVSFWFADMDNMKGINDQFGHKAGDAAIQGLGCAMKRVADTYGLFAMRYGGDEFLMFGAEDPNRIYDEVMQEVDRIRLSREVLEHSNDPFASPEEINPARAARFREDGSVIVAASVGVFTIEANERVPLEECISIADTKMYENKKKRKRSQL